MEFINKMYEIDEFIKFDEDPECGCGEQCLQNYKVYCLLTD